MNLFGFQIEVSALGLGLITGLGYGLIAVGLVIVYRTSKIINFAQAQIGWFAAAMMALAINRWHIPYLLMFFAAIAIGGGVGAGTEVAVVRRLRKSPPLLTMVATLGVAQALLLFSTVLYPQSESGGSGISTVGHTYPDPPWVPTFKIGILQVGPASTAMLILSPLVVLALTLFFHRSRFGLAIRASSSNRDAARASGISADTMATLAWGVAGALSAFAAVFILPSQPSVTAAFGTGLLLRALAAALIGKMTNLPLAFCGGLLIGVVEAVVQWNYIAGGPTELVIFILILVPLLLRRDRRGRGSDSRGSYSAVEVWRRLPDHLLAIPSIRRLGMTVAIAAFALLALLPLIISNASAFVLIAIMSFGLVGLSVGIVSGLGGQLTLGQFALSGIGAAVSYQLTQLTGNHLIGLIGAGVGAAAVALLVGLPAIRIAGPMLAVTTLALATSAELWLFRQPWMFGDGVVAGRPKIGPWRLDTERAYYFFVLAVFIGGIVIARNFWAGGLRRRLVALRDNEDAARSFGIPATRVKLQAFMFAGFLAGIGGAVYSSAFTLTTDMTFLSSRSIDVVAMAVIGGIGMLAGPLLGALYIIGVPGFVNLDTAGLAATALGWLLLVLYLPGGFAQVIRPIRDRVVAWLAKRHGVAFEAPDEGSLEINRLPLSVPSSAATEGGEPVGRAAPDESAAIVLSVSNVSRSFGEIHAVQGVTFDVRDQETVGIIGPNGAGKTTLFELLSGFTSLDTGTVVYRGRDISRTGPVERARLGLIRSFQDSALFPTMTTLEAVEVAHERLAPTNFVSAISGSRRGDRAKEVGARELLNVMGLSRYRNKRVDELSTGTRRIVELACLFALRPDLVLLDEPTAGIAQRETEALRDVLVRVKEALQLTLVVIEHDVPLLLSICDRIVAMEAGRVLLEGVPTEVRHDERVIESFLGGDVRAIERSTIAPV